MGTGSELSRGEIWGEGEELNCPECYASIDFLEFPTIEESRANWDKLSEPERKKIEHTEARLAKFETMKLSRETILPDIREKEFVLSWDFDKKDNGSPETVIKYGSIILHREPAFYEGQWRFTEIAEILKARYGHALRDLVPTEASKLFLYGDTLSTVNAVEKTREAIALP
jgi:hypothetical protein